MVTEDIKPRVHRQFWWFFKTDKTNNKKQLQKGVCNSAMEICKKTWTQHMRQGEAYFLGNLFYFFTTHYTIHITYNIYIYATCNT